MPQSHGFGYPIRNWRTASTGIAACNIGGVTLHSFAGFGLGTGTVEQLVKYIKRNKKTVQKWTRTKVLIIDESTLRFCQSSVTRI